jgi:hypothetical protein
MTKNAKSKIGSFLKDLFLVLGFASIAYGLYIIWLPAALVICGAMLIFAGIPKKKKTVVYKNQPKRPE